MRVTGVGGRGTPRHATHATHAHDAPRADAGYTGCCHRSPGCVAFLAVCVCMCGACEPVAGSVHAAPLQVCAAGRDSRRTLPHSCLCLVTCPRAPPQARRRGEACRRSGVRTRHHGRGQNAPARTLAHAHTATHTPRTRMAPRCGSCSRRHSRACGPGTRSSAITCGVGLMLQVSARRRRCECVAAAWSSPPCPLTPR